MMDHGQEITWLTIINTFVNNLPTTLTSLSVLLGGGYAFYLAINKRTSEKIDSAKGEVNKKIDKAQESVNKNVNEVKQSVEENTDITVNMPAESAARMEHKLTNGLGDHIAKITAEKVKEDASVAAKGVAKEVMKAEAVQHVIQAAAQEVAAVRASDSYSKGFADGLEEGERRAIARKGAETDLAIPNLDTLQKERDKHKEQ